MTVIAVVGPTAAGKSALSISLAQRLGGEVINADSMQLYQGMDIGTAKLTMAERQGIPHHLLDIWPVTQAASVAEYQVLARAEIDKVLHRGLIPLLVGGSGLYVRAVLEDFDFPGTDSGLRTSLETELASVGPGEMHRRLAEIDPEAVARILPSNGRRIVRALEVISLTGRPFTAALPSEPKRVYDCVQIAVDRDDLDERVEQRVDRMWREGLVEEVRGLERQGLRRGLTASRALGYQQILGFLDGSISEEQAYLATITGTRRFVRRQRSWLRRDPSVVWLDGAADDLADQAFAIIGSKRLDR